MNIPPSKDIDFFNTIYPNLNSYKIRFISSAESRNNPAIAQIINGTKTVEGRLNSNRFNKWKENDLLCICDLNKKKSSKGIIPWNQFALCRISYIKKYTTFQQMIEEEGYKNLMPSSRDPEDIMDFYHQIYRPDLLNPKAEETATGVRAIGLEYLIGSTKLTPYPPR